MRVQTAVAVTKFTSNIESLTARKYLHYCMLYVILNVYHNIERYYYGIQNRR